MDWDERMRLVERGPGAVRPATSSSTLSPCQVVRAEDDQVWVAFGDGRHEVGPIPLPPYAAGMEPQPGDVALVAYLGAGIDSHWLVTWRSPA